MNESKSIARSKRSTLTVAALLAKEGVAAIVPGGGLMFEVGKVLFDHGKRYITDRNDERLTRFHSVLLDPEGHSEQQEELLNGEFEADDYHAILSSCVQDIEDLKTDVYACLLKSFIVEHVADGERQLYIQAAKTLSMLDIHFLRELYINSKHDLMTPGGASQQLEELFSTQAPLRQISLSRFGYLGFVDPEGKALSVLGQRFVRRVSAGDELTPDTIGRKAWTGIMINILCFEIDNDDHSRFYLPLGKILRSKQIKSHTQVIDSRRKLAFIFWSGGILLVGDLPVEGPYLKALQMYSERLPLIRINVTANGVAQALEGVEFKAIYSVANCAQGKEGERLEQIVDEVFA